MLSETPEISSMPVEQNKNAVFKGYIYSGK